MKKGTAILLFSTTICFGAEQENQGVIQATLHINHRTSIPSIWYNSWGQERVKKDLDLEMAVNMPMIDIIAIDNGSRILVPENLNEFTDWLPLSLVLGKKGGDTIELTTKGGTKVILTCQDRFEGLLTFYLKKFKKKPVIHLLDEAALLEKGIITKNERGKFQHGPNGYNFDGISGLDDDDLSDVSSDSSNYISSSSDDTDDDSDTYSTHSAGSIDEEKPD